MEGRQALLAHSSSETTKIYTHPNLELAFEYINKMPDFSHLDSWLNKIVSTIQNYAKMQWKKVQKKSSRKAKTPSFSLETQGLV